VLGGQASVSLIGVGGRNWASIDATLTGPRGNEISGSKSQALTSVGDLFPLATLKWNQGVNNYMVYGMGDVPVGDYNSARLANLGLGHGAIDGGAGYTYLNPANGLEFAAVVGMSYNFINPSTQYQNGLDAHLDWGASYGVLDVGLLRTSGGDAPPLSIYRHDGCDSANALARRSGAQLGRSIERCAPLGLKQGRLLDENVSRRKLGRKLHGNET
jgi:hypothetical protein